MILGPTDLNHDCYKYYLTRALNTADRILVAVGQVTKTAKNVVFPLTNLGTCIHLSTSSGIK